MRRYEHALYADRKFPIHCADGNCECLQGIQRVPKVEDELILAYLAKLKYDIVRICLRISVNELEVLH